MYIPFGGFEFWERLSCIPIPSLFLRLDNEKRGRPSRDRVTWCELVQLVNLTTCSEHVREGSRGPRSFLDLRPTRDVIG